MSPRPEESCWTWRVSAPDGATHTEPPVGGVSPVSVCLGGEADLMSRRIVAANNRNIAERLVKEIVAFSLLRDDAPPPKQ